MVAAKGKKNGHRAKGTESPPKSHPAKPPHTTEVTEQREAGGLIREISASAVAVSDVAGKLKARKDKEIMGDEEEDANRGIALLLLDAIDSPEGILEKWGFKVNTRVAVGGVLGTVAYSGPVDFAPGGWLGVILDPGFTGHNNGSHGGRAYFSCAPRSGVLVRPYHVKAAEEDPSAGQEDLDERCNRLAYWRPQEGLVHHAALMRNVLRLGTPATRLGTPPTRSQANTMARLQDEEGEEGGDYHGHHQHDRHHGHHQSSHTNAEAARSDVPAARKGLEPVAGAGGVRCTPGALVIAPTEGSKTIRMDDLSIAGRDGSGHNMGNLDSQSSHRPPPKQKHAKSAHPIRPGH